MLHSATLFVDVAMHIFILFTFLAIFFFAYISKIERNAFQDEFSDLINDNLPQLLTRADQASSGAVKRGLQEIPTFLAFLNKAYDKPDPVVQSYNNWLMVVALSISVILLVMIMGGVMVRDTGCLISSFDKIPLKKLIAKNLLTFLLVGLIEGVFFVFIAKKYVPAKPSQLLGNIIQRLKENLGAAATPPSDTCYNIR